MKKDLSRRAVERAASIVVRTRERVRERVPYGPNAVALTPAELRKRIMRMRGEELMQLFQALGPEKFNELLGV